MKRLLIVLAVAALAVSASKAQHLGATQIQINNGTSVGTLSAPGVAGTYTWTLPAQSGTLSLSSVGGWLIGGNGLLPTNPGLLGSTDAADVSLIAGGVSNVRMTLLNGTAAVLLPSETQLRLGDASGGEFVALVSPATNKTSGYTFVLPDTLPGGDDVRIKVNQISGNTVYLGYTNPATTGQIGFNGSGAETCNTSTTTWVDVTGISFGVGPSAIYSFECFVDVEAGGSNAEITWGQSGGSTTDPSGTVVHYKVFNLTDNGNDEAGGTQANVLTIDAGDISLLKGYIQTDNTTPANSTIVLLVRKGASGSETCITSKSAVQLVTE